MDSNHDQRHDANELLSISPSKNKGVKDFQEQLREFTLLDKIVPDIKHTKGCFVQVTAGDSCPIGQIVSISEDGLSLVVRMLHSQAEERVSARSIRFLTRAYTCPLEDLDAKQFPQELSSIIGSNTQQHVVLVQVVYAMQAETALAEDPEAKSG